MRIHRIPLFDFPDVVLHAGEIAVKGHRQYPSAKAGGIVAAGIVVAELLNESSVSRLSLLLNKQDAELVPVHALESEGVNELPAALAKALSRQLAMPINETIVQTNSVGHTGASGFHRLANQAQFEGQVIPGKAYVVVDDFVGQGGTLANLIGFISTNGGHVLAATVLTGKPYSAKLAPDQGLIQALRHKHGRDIEDWWRGTFGFDFDRLTRSEARYLEKTADALTIRDRIAAAGSDVGA